MRDLSVPYTRLSGDAFWNKVSMQHMLPVTRKYHVMEHIVDMYKYAKELDLDYDINLDVAILIHDVIYDGGKHAELRSIQYFIDMVKNYTKDKNMLLIPEKVFMPFGVIEPLKIIDFVLSTIDHTPKKDIDNTLMMLDLYSFAKGETVRNVNYKKLMEELIGLYPEHTPLDIKYNVRNNLIRICTNIVNYTVSLDETDKFYQIWIDIQNGIAKHIEKIEKEMIEDYKKTEKVNM